MQSNLNHNAEKKSYHGFEAVKSDVLKQNDAMNYQADKIIAHDKNLPSKTRMNAAVEAVKDKGKEIGHGLQQEVHKQRAIH